MLERLCFPENRTRLLFVVECLVLQVAIVSTLYAGDGTLKFMFDTGGAIQSSAAIGDDNVIFFASNDNSVYALNPDFTLQWSVDIGADVRLPIAVGGDGMIYSARASKGSSLHSILTEVPGGPSIPSWMIRSRVRWRLRRTGPSMRPSGPRLARHFMPSIRTVVSFGTSRAQRPLSLESRLGPKGSLP